LRLARYFGTSVEFWMGLQVDYDVAVARLATADALEGITRCTALNA
jgi:plasmid maintenance system antidote protein VapI